MGVNDAKRSAKEDRKNAAFAKRAAAQKVRPSGVVADWGGVDPLQLQRTVATVCLSGDAIRLGYTRDGGAYAVALLHNGESHTDYVSPSDDIEAYLKGLEDDYREE